MGQTWGSMSYIKEIALKNYRSFVDARCRLSPFTLIVGANNAGKSNLLKAVEDFSKWWCDFDFDDLFGTQWIVTRHHAAKEGEADVSLSWSDGTRTETRSSPTIVMGGLRQVGNESNPLRTPIPIFRFDPELIGRPEEKTGKVGLSAVGSGVSATLDQWNAGVKANRDRFARVVAELSRCIPEIEAISFFDDDKGRRGIQVEQSGIPKAVPLSEVSEGTRIVLAILTLLNLETPPPVMLIEDIDRGLHPRLYEKLVEFLRSVTMSGRTQIVATTHNPYLLDEFEDMPEAVVVVEKKDGASTLSNLDERLRAILKPGAELEMPLGELWFSGSLGGVPGMKLPDLINPRAA